MQDLPPSLRVAIPAELVSEAELWWQALTDADRDELVRLCDARREIFLFETCDGTDENPRISGGRFLPHDDTFGKQEWGEDYFETLLANPELMIVHDPPRRTFHIGCSRHVHARRCFQEGKIASDFACPFGQDDCLMHRIRQEREMVGLRPLANTG